VPASLDRVKKRRVYERERVAFLWHIDPMERLLTAYALVGAAYRELATWGADDTVVRVAPFDATELDLALLWAPLPARENPAIEAMASCVAPAGIGGEQGVGVDHGPGRRNRDWAKCARSVCDGVRRGFSATLARGARTLPRPCRTLAKFDGVR
jgi:hypothetical protein